jgi:hypothetical protein
VADGSLQDEGKKALANCGVDLKSVSEMTNQKWHRLIP